MREKAAFQLAGLDADDAGVREKFADLVQKGHLQYPLLSSLRVAVDLKEAKEENASQQQGATQSQFVGETEVRMTIVEAEEQDLTKTPNVSLLTLLDFVSKCEEQQDIMTPSKLSSIRSSVHHPIMVDTGATSMPCAKTLTLILATERSTQEKISDGTFRLTTANVIIALGDKSIKYTLTTLCDKDKLSEAVIVPPRSGSRQQAAIVTITGMLGPSEFLLEGVQTVTVEELPAVYALFRKLLTVTKNIEFTGTEKKPLWDDQTKNPVREAKKCKVLSASPSDASLPGTD